MPDTPAEGAAVPKADDQPPVKRQRRTKEAKPPPPTVNPTGACNLWLPKKARFCSFALATPESKFCGHHLETRVPCTINPNHTVKASSLAEHVLVCHDRCMLPPTDAPYYSKGVNSGDPAPAESVPLTNEIFSETLGILQGYSLPEEIPTEVNTWPPPGTTATTTASTTPDTTAATTPPPGTPAGTTRSEKHETQIASLLGHIHAIGALPCRDLRVTFKGPSKGGVGEIKGGTAAAQPTSDKTYVEFGAGKGALAVSVARVLYGEGEGAGEDDKVLLLDRSNFRRKCIHPCFERIQIDLEDLVLSAVPKLRPVVGFSKHLCGVATDFTLRCSAASAESVHSLSIALCCHQKCTFEGYINKPYLEGLGITAQHFAALKKITSWTVDGEEGVEHNGIPKNVWGRRAKRMLDFGRVMFLRDNGFDARLVHFIPESTTPENCLLVATRRAGAAAEGAK